MMAMDPTKPWQDAIDPRYAELGPYGSLEQAIAYGVQPVNGMVFRGNQMPGTGVDHSTGKMYEPGFTKGGSWQYIGQQDSVGQWQFVEQQAPQAAQPMEQPKEEPLPEYPKGDIYNDWDYYQGRARADVEGINKMPFMFSDYADIGLRTPQQNMNTFYPPSWQEEGVQKTIGPNGQNIAPKLQETFGNAQAINTNGQTDFPSLVKKLMASGSIDSGQEQMLLGLIKPKKPDMSFANQMLMNK